jgi:integrase
MDHYQRHVKSVRQLKKMGFVPLDCPETKEASYPYAREWARSVSAQKRLSVLPESHRDALAQIPEGAAPAIRELLENDTVDPLHPSMVRELMKYVPVVTPAPQSKTIGEAAESWLTLAIKPRADSGAISSREVTNHCYGVRHFREWAGDHTPVDEITPVKWAEFYAHLSALVIKKTYSSTYCKKALRYTRDFLGWCAEIGFLAPLSNLRSRKMAIGESRPEKEILTVDQVKLLLGAAKGQTRLHVLLALNCGFTQVDISDLAPEEAKDGRITRRRSKTRRKKTTPEVSYLLWAETSTSLEEHRSSDPLRVLLTHTGKPWVDSSRHGADSIRTQYGYLQKKTGITASFKAFRKTAATALERHPEYRSYVQYFLGHAPQTVAQAHYTTPDQDDFDRAIRWLGEQFGIK